MSICVASSFFKIHKVASPQTLICGRTLSFFLCKSRHERWVYSHYDPRSEVSSEVDWVSGSRRSCPSIVNGHPIERVPVPMSAFSNSNRRNVEKVINLFIKTNKIECTVSTANLLIIPINWFHCSIVCSDQGWTLQVKCFERSSSQSDIYSEW